MANNFVHYGNRITLGSEGGSGISDIAQKKPYEDSDYGGLAVINGPVQVGYAPLANPPKGVLHVGPSVSTSGPASTQSAFIEGDVRIEGNGKTDNALYVKNGGTTDTVYIDGDLYVSGSIDGDNKGRLKSRFDTADALGKSFDMQHPTKGEGWRLNHACIEGPEIGVYYRGRLKGGLNKIQLPDYWKGLVHSDSISVQLQPIGAYQELFVEKIEWGTTIIVKNNLGGIIDCYYHVYGERKDLNPLHVEYEGNSWKDYPDPHVLNKDPEDPERNLLDPKYAGSRNTITT